MSRLATTMSRAMMSDATTTKFQRLVPTPAALRAEFEDMVVKDLLGPIWGEEERLPGGGRVSEEWYILGTLAPRNTVGTDPERSDNSEGAVGDAAAEADTEPEEKMAVKM